MPAGARGLPGRGGHGLLPELGGDTQPTEDVDFARQHLYAAVAAVLTRLAASCPLALMVEDVHFSTLTSQDVVRHKLVGRIVDAYAQYDAEEATRGPQRTPTRPPGRRDDVRRSH